MKQQSSIRLIGRALEVLRVINRLGAPSMVEIANAVELPYPTTLRIVRALIEEGVIERENARKRYRATPLILGLSYGFQTHDALVATARSHINALTDRLHWPVNIVTPVGRQMVIRDSTSTRTAMTFNHYFPGWQVPLIRSSSGRAYLAMANEQIRSQMYAHLESSGTEGDVMMLRAFESSGQAEQIRKQGYAAVARSDYSASPGRTSSFSVPLHQGEDLLGTVTLVFFASALSLDDAVERYLPSVRATAEAIGQAMLAGTSTDTNSP